MYEDLQQNEWCKQPETGSMIINDPVTLINKPSNLKLVTIGEGFVVQQASELCRMTGFEVGKGIAIMEPYQLAYSKNKHKTTS